MAKNLKNLFPGLAYVPGDTFVHRLHPLPKLLLLIVYSVSVIIFSQVVPAVALFFILLVFYGRSGLGPVFFLRKLRVILMFGLLMMLVQVISVRQGTLLWEYAVFGGVTLRVWSAGAAAGLVMMLRFINIIASSYLFVSTTDPNKLAYALMQVGLPYRYGFMLITSLRFIPVFTQELTIIRNAQMAKGIDLEGVTPGKALRAVKYLLTPLVICALNKVDYLAVSMESRAFGLFPGRSYLFEQSVDKKEWLFLAACTVLLLAGGLFLTRCY
ncbi:MAG: energy-coupling factor transporter transmembrane component T [Desulfotomaculaceae bacterium]|nr:energy-coupling factor transporter transmembrane component T [Desulfotomaculaceae bacterium]MDD4767213.1 energy-coupling factor transporter transmembrane component T [Desulfotomaculaceae bacterium]